MTLLIGIALFFWVIAFSFATCLWKINQGLNLFQELIGLLCFWVLTVDDRKLYESMF